MGAFSIQGDERILPFCRLDISVVKFGVVVVVVGVVGTRV